MILNKVILIANENQEKFQQEVNNFLNSISNDQFISIQYTTTPTSINTHSEFGVYPSVEYSVLICYKD